MSVRLNEVLRNILYISQESILSHPLDQLLGKVCDACNQLFGSDLTWIGLIQQQSHLITPIAASGQEDYLAEVLALAPSSLDDDNNPTAKALRTKETITDNINDDNCPQGGWQDFLRKWSFLSTCSLPLLSDGEPLGVVTLYSKKKDAFPSQNVMTLELLANLATIVIKNARLNDEKTHLQAEQKNLLNAIEANIDGIALCTLQGVYTYMNPAYAKIYGYNSAAKLLGKSWKTIYSPVERVYFYKHIMPQLMESGLWRGEAQGQKRDGTIFHQEISLTFLKDQAGQASGIICNARDITERKAMELEIINTKEQLESLVEQLKTLAVTDDLTSLYNIRKFYEDLKKEMKRSSRTGQVFSLLVVDIDNFKQYNDIHGHLGGDKVLKKIGRLLKNTLRKTDLAYRYGGDEFVIILTETTSDQAKEVADKLRFNYEKLGLNPTTLSIGIAEYNPEYDHEQIIRLADGAMYEAKKQGNKVCITSQIPVHLM
ncbi:MAG: diguanylate cyclase [Clostridia bacterium]|nr:diguanylate cyclase [Clostridia bacterium]